MPAASRKPNRSLLRDAVRAPNQMSSAEQAEQHDDPDEPELLPDDGEDEIRLGKRKIAVLLHRVEQPRPEPPAVPQTRTATG